jgi:hypothetical protein
MLAKFLRAVTVAQMQPKRRRMHAKPLAAFGCMRMHAHARKIFACSGRDPDAPNRQAHARKSFGGIRLHAFCMCCTVHVAGCKKIVHGGCMLAK